MKWGYFVPSHNREKYIERLSKLPNVHFVENGSTDNALQLIKDSGAPYISLETSGNIIAYNACLEWAQTLGMDRIIIMHTDDYPVRDWIGEKIFKGGCDGLTFYGYISLLEDSIRKVFTATNLLDSSKVAVDYEWILDYLLYGRPKKFANIPTWIIGKDAMSLRFDEDLPNFAESQFVYDAYLKELEMEYWSIVGVAITHFGSDRVSATFDEANFNKELILLEEKYGYPQSRF